MAKANVRRYFLNFALFGQVPCHLPPGDLHVPPSLATLRSMMSLVNLILWPLSKLIEVPFFCTIFRILICSAIGRNKMAIAKPPEVLAGLGNSVGEGDVHLEVGGASTAHLLSKTEVFYGGRPPEKLCIRHSSVVVDGYTPIAEFRPPAPLSSSTTATPASAPACLSTSLATSSVSTTTSSTCPPANTTT